MTIRYLLALATLAVVFQIPCHGQEPQASLAGRWQYLQPPDTEGEVLDLFTTSNHWRGIMNGLERAGEHGLFYYVVEIEKLVVLPDGNISFEIGERQFFAQRPALSHLGGNGDSGFARLHLRFSGRIVGGDLVLYCSDEDGSCPDSTLRFKKLSTLPDPGPAFQRGAPKSGYQKGVPALETGPETVCRSNADCWCRQFTGAQFLEGKANSLCRNNCCVRCLYD